jgi:hypothetical protein
LRDGAERDLGGLGAPAYTLGPATIEGGLILVHNSGAEFGEIGSFWLSDLEGNPVENPVCLTAIVCDQPSQLLGALGPRGKRLAYVLDRMQPGTESEYEIVDRSYGVVDLQSGVPVIKVELDVQGGVAWLDFDGERGVISMGDSVYLVHADGTVDPLNVDGIATFPR